MAKGITKRQHYVPRMILKRHMISDAPYRINMIWQYDKKLKMERCVNIKAACVEKNLYEAKDESGNVLAGTENVIERLLSVGEKDANRILGVLEDKRRLSKDDMTRLYGFVSFQTLRVPMFMDYMRKYLFSDLLDSLDYYGRNQVLYSSFLSDAAAPERSILGWNMWNLCGHQMYVLNSKSPFLLCGDAPVQFLFCSVISEFPVIVFPVSRFQCLLFVRSNGICFDGIHKNVCGGTVDCLNGRLFMGCFRFVYGSVRPSDVVGGLSM